jgi:hypothetical protein
MKPTFAYFAWINEKEESEGCQKSFSICFFKYNIYKLKAAQK